MRTVRVVSSHRARQPRQYLAIVGLKSRKNVLESYRAHSRRRSGYGVSAMPKSDAIVRVPSASPSDLSDGLDEDLVDKAVDHIRSVIERTVEKGLEEVGTYLLKTFYSNDAEAYFSHQPVKKASLSLLVERCNSIALPISRSFLADALRVAAISRHLPSNAPYRQLPVSHRIALSRVDDVARRDRLAMKAAENELSVKKLRALVQKEVERQRASGASSRRGVPPIVKALEAVVSLLRDDETGRLPFKRADVKELGPGYRERADAAYAQLVPRFDDLERLMRR